MRYGLAPFRRYDAHCRRRANPRSGPDLSTERESHQPVVDHHCGLNGVVAPHESPTANNPWVEAVTPYASAWVAEGGICTATVVWTFPFQCATYGLDTVPEKVAPDSHMSVPRTLNPSRRGLPVPAVATVIHWCPSKCSSELTFAFCPMAHMLDGPLPSMRWMSTPPGAVVTCQCLHHRGRDIRRRPPRCPSRKQDTDLPSHFPRCGI